MATAEQDPNNQPADTDPVTIIRYPNRRLYDRSQGKYVTLQDVEDAVRRGRTVVVRDSKTGEDLTRVILTQIVLERHPERMELFPVAFLHLMIRANDVMLGSLRDYVRQSLLYVDVLQRAAPLNPFGVSQDWLRAFMPVLPQAAAPDTASGNAPIDTRILLQRIAELEQRIGELQQRPANDRPKTRSRKNRSKSPAEPPPTDELREDVPARPTD